MLFHSAALRLTVWYLAIIMAVSIIFSGMLYRVSADNLRRNINSQIGYFTNFLGPGDFDNYARLRQNQLSRDMNQLKANLIIFNLLVLAGGGAASYWLARRTLKPIENALELQSRFAADASHELRTPLSAIQTENEVALRNPGLTKRQATNLLKSNLEEIARLKGLSEGLLRLANTGQAEDPQTISVNTAIQTAIDRLSKTAVQKKIRITNKSKHLMVRGYPDSLSELFYIFLDNAIKYSPAKSQVTITARRHHRSVQVKISDQGEGISQTDLPSIFERFYRAEHSRSRNDSGGYGLGLAIAKKIAEAHHGYIEVSSVLGKGTSFIVHLPSA